MPPTEPARSRAAWGMGPHGRSYAGLADAIGINCHGNCSLLNSDAQSRRARVKIEGSNCMYTPSELVISR